MLPSLLSTQLVSGMRDFLRASFWSNVPGFDTMIERLVEQPHALTRGPYISIKLPFARGIGGASFFPNVPMKWPPHAHQEAAFKRLSGPTRQHTLVATGTGSGKTESFLLPILAACETQQNQRGIKAILIYPMNALATDQATRLAKFIHENENLRGRVSAGLFVGQKEENPTVLMGPDQVITDRDRLINDPPDILLTNYKMLDYLLMRPRDQKIWAKNSPEMLQFIVVDELHTFDGAQGTDLACLLRRLKQKLHTPKDHLCCIGTSATLGSDSQMEKLVSYASQVFGERFELDAVITEQRLTQEQFLSDARTEFFTHPQKDSLSELALVGFDDADAYVDASYQAWFGEPLDRTDDNWRVNLSKFLKEHMFLHRILGAMKGHIVELEELVERLNNNHKSYRLHSPEELEQLVLSFLTLISTARVHVAETDQQRAQREELGLHPVEIPFLQVQLQLWQRELRRMLATVESEPRLAFADDLTEEQRRQHLPAVYCPNCSLMGWASLVKENHKEELEIDLKTFYARYFANDPRVELIFPEGVVQGGSRWLLNTLTLKRRMANNNEEPDTYEIPVTAIETAVGEQGKRRMSGDCPRCRSHRSLTLLGFRAATLIASFISQIYASRFNDDKKLLTFSDSVQDAAHRAGFFEARTWRFVMRTAIQQGLQTESGFDPSLDKLGEQIAKHWLERLGPESFVATFIPPKMDMEKDYKTLQKTGRLPRNSPLPMYITRRIGWEAFAAYSFESKLGRTLPRTSCSIAYIEDHRLKEAAERCAVELPNKVGLSRKELTFTEAQHFILGLLQHLISQGAILHRELENSSYMTSAGKDTFGTFTRSVYLKSYGPNSRLPLFPVTRGSSARFENIATKSAKNWYTSWFDTSLGGASNADNFQLLTSDHLAAYETIFEILSGAGIVRSIETDGRTIWGIKPEVVHISTEVSQLACHHCKQELAVATHQLEHWQGSGCLSSHCAGTYKILEPDDVVLGSGYYTHLYNQGDVIRVVTAEHTGLLERDTRQDIERRFKSKDSQRWEPNLLSCTPTLEMGIDIGDLSTALLCSIPPTQANYVQRVGRAGRRDGNALIVAIASAKPHDLYFFQEPLEMLSGEVAPPGVFLNASAVLERQLIAYCLDCWVQEHEVRKTEFPDTLERIITGLQQKPDNIFPHNFNNFVISNQSRLLEDFLSMFSEEEISEETRAHLKDYIFGTGIHLAEGHLMWRIYDGLSQRETEYRELLRTANQLTPKIKKIEDLHTLSKDQEDELKLMRSEQYALRMLAEQLKKTRTLEFLTDEGLIPNYAFPEQGVTLKSIIWRKNDGDKAYTRTPHEYVRPASTALSELAPHNQFYAEGYQVKIERVDMNISKMERWRFCDNCEHAEPIDKGDHHSACPTCGSAQWADQGQLRNMLKLRQVFASASEKKGRIRDDSDDRSPRFYTRQMLVSVETPSTDGWHITKKDLPFGFEYIQRAVFRDINFGELNDVGKKVTIAGRESVRNGFELCTECGRVQPQGKNAAREHEPTCRGKSDKNHGEQYIEPCLYLYREVKSEAVRILLPFLEEVGANEASHSFMAALQMGLQQFFGGSIDHLHATIYTEPSMDNTRKQFLMLYDTVPGGTGYLKDLVRSPEKVFNIMEMALDRLRTCECQKDPSRDGCYRCIFAYRNAYEMADTSRDRAIDMLAQLVRHKSEVEKVKSLSDIGTSSLFDSNLERMFVESLKHLSLDNSQDRPSLSKEIIRGRQGYRFSYRDIVWEVTPQYYMGMKQGVEVNSNPDFLIEPVTLRGKRKPIAVFLDGWQYHKRNVMDDQLKRMAIIRSGNYRVWSIHYYDVKEVLDHVDNTKVRRFLKKDHQFEELLKLCAEKFKVKHLEERFHQSAMQLLMEYMCADVEEEETSVWLPLASVFTTALMSHKHADASSPDKMDILKHRSDELDQVFTGLFKSVLHKRVRSIRKDTLEVIGAAGEPRSRTTEAIFNCMKAVMVLDGYDDHVEDLKQRNRWQELLHLSNILQFLNEFYVFVTGNYELHHDLAFLQSAPVYEELVEQSEVLEELDEEMRELWEVCLECALEDELPLLNELMSKNVPPPEVGYEYLNEKGHPQDYIEYYWEEQRAMVVEDEDQLKKYKKLGFFVVLLDEVKADVSALVSHLQS